jgi:hypothetical protein
MSPNEQKWLVELSGRETIRNRRIERDGSKDVMVFGTAHIGYSLATEVTLKQVEGKWGYGSGKITRAAITSHDAAYTPANIHKVKRIYCSNTASITRMAGQQIGGALEGEKILMLFWPMPKNWRDPAVVIVIEDKDKPGGEEEAVFESYHFLDYAGEFKLQLRNGIQRFERGFEGGADKAHTEYQFNLRQLM